MLKGSSAFNKNTSKERFSTGETWWSAHSTFKCKNRWLTGRSDICQIKAHVLRGAVDIKHDLLERFKNTKIMRNTAVIVLFSRTILDKWQELTVNIIYARLTDCEVENGISIWTNLFGFLWNFAKIISKCRFYHPDVRHSITVG